MPKVASSQPKTPMQMVEALNTRVAASARSYKMATVRYLMRPPLSLRAKYAAFLLDFAQQSDLIQDVLGRTRRWQSCCASTSVRRKRGFSW